LHVMELEAVIRGRNDSLAATGGQEAPKTPWLKKEKPLRATASPKMFAAAG